MKKILCILLALCLAAGLCACGGSSAPAGAPAESAPAESTPAESEPACEHEWAPATHTQPETCTICGETRGEPKGTGFAENGLTASPIPSDGEKVPLTYLTYSEIDPEIFTVRDNGVVALSQTVEPAEQEGYKLVTLEVNATFEITPDESTAIYYNTFWNDGLYDFYTGCKVPAQSAEAYDSAFAYEGELEVDGTVYPLQYNYYYNSRMTFDVEGDDGGIAYYLSFYELVIEVLMPEEYDGLVYALRPALEVPADPSYTGIHGKESYVTDLAPEELAGTAFFRVGV